MRILHDGVWREVTVLGIGDGEQLLPVTIPGESSGDSTAEATLTVTSAATPFTPWVTCWPGGTVEWCDETGTVLSTDLQPSLTGHTTYRLRATPDAVRYLNLGFSHAACGPFVRSSYHADLQAKGMEVK